MDGTIPTSIHPVLSFWVDFIVKVIAVILGALWTIWNYTKSRPYSQKLDLEIIGDLFFKESLYIDINVALKNLGAAKHKLQHEGTSCDLILVHADLSEQSVRLFSVFDLHNGIEPGESINDRILWRIEAPSPDIVWLRVNLRVVSDNVEWNRTSMVRVFHPTKM